MTSFASQSLRLALSIITCSSPAISVYIELAQPSYFPELTHRHRAPTQTSPPPPCLPPFCIHFLDRCSYATRFVPYTMSTTFLQRKRKGELLELANRAGLADAENLLKDDLVEQLFDHLEADEARFAKLPEFRDFYKRTGSPVKREKGSPSESLPVTKTRRRQTVSKLPDSDEPTPERGLVTRTPRAVSRVTSRLSNVEYPASPSQLAEAADQSFQAAKAKASDLWKEYIDTGIDFLRENASSVTVIQILLLAVEGVGFEWNTLVPYQYKPPAQLNYNGDIPLPNLSLVLTSGYWAPATLWSLTSWFLPLVFSYFFNLTLRSNTHHRSARGQYHVDPFTFNIVKAVLTYSAYSAALPLNVIGADGFEKANPSWGPFSSETVNTVRYNAPGGYHGLLISSAVGLLVSLYDAALKK
ncbi:hypothetical protein BDV96DRAFT_586883 [Lophiotrema nucula]|uniref:Uncharacterized protein n=1 Tax=Lophiotrema nucula TaxID=690887 RepID=A0A6A5YPK4_9PLEO|nr:hypothetical protein BDV96DRAFT_586883 [Lophiotrema nucula]